MRPLLVLYLLFLCLIFLFYTASHTLYEAGYVHLNVLFYAEKVLLAKEGEPPRLENIGLVYPPLAFLPFWFVSDYLMASPFASAITLTLFFSFLLKRCLSPVYFIVVSLLLNPLTIFLAVYRFEVLSFYILLTLSVMFLILHMEMGYSIYLFVGGFLLGLCFFFDFRSVFLIPLFVLFIFFTTKQAGRDYTLALTMVKLTPIVFFVFIWLYLNWVFTGDPLTFIKSPYSFFKGRALGTDVLVAKGSIFGSLKYSALQLFYLLPLILPYVVVLFKLKKYRVLYLFPLYLLYLSPITLMLFSIYFSYFFPSYYYSVLFLAFAVTFASSLNIRGSKALAVAFIVSFLASWVLPLYSKEENEKNFVKFLLTGRVKENIGEYIKVAKVLKDQGCEKTLLDDKTDFPVVVFSQNPKKFYLPYMYEYYSALSTPIAFADCILVNKNSQNIILDRFPTSKMGFLKGYMLVYSDETYNVFKRVR